MQFLQIQVNLIIPFAISSTVKRGLSCFIVIQLEKRLAVLKLRLRFPFRSPPVGGSLHSQRSPRAPRDSTFSKLNGYTVD